MFLDRNPLVLLALVTSLMLSACAGESEEGTPDADPSNVRVVKVNTTEVSPMAFEDIIPVTGVLSAPNDATLSAQSAGTIVELMEIGDRVQEGAVVARLDDRLIKAALEQARATRTSVSSAASLAEDLFKRQEPLYRDSIISAIEFENVRAQLNQARAALTQAEAAVSQTQQQLENTIVRAPFSGTIERRLVEQGEQIAPGLPIVRIVNTSVLKVQAGVPERYAADIRVGSPVKISLKSYGGDLASSSVAFVGSVIDPDNRTFLIEMDLNNGNRGLKPEMIVDVLLTRKVLQNQLVLPQTSILRDELGSSVYVVDTSGSAPKAKRVSVETGASFGGKTIIVNGLVAGQQVITVGQEMVSDGDLVEVVANPS